LKGGERAQGKGKAKNVSGFPEKGGKKRYRHEKGEYDERRREKGGARSPLTSLEKERIRRKGRAISYSAKKTRRGRFSPSHVKGKIGYGTKVNKKGEGRSEKKAIQRGKMALTILGRWEN